MDPARASFVRLWLERCVWFIDMASYGAMGLAGVYGAVDPSSYVEETLGNHSWIIALWGCLLVCGGLVAFLGRLVRNWAIEITANVLAAWGSFLYLLILLPAFAEGSSSALGAVVFIAWMFMLRRYIELRIFTLEPGVQVTRWVDIFRRRTKNTVPRRHY